MRKILIISILLSMGLVPTFAQSPVNVNPLNVALTIVEDIDTAKMAEKCRYYGLIEAQSEGEYKVFISTDGTKVRFKMISEGPEVEVITKKRPKEVKTYIQKMGFYYLEKSSSILVDRTRQITITEKPTTLRIQKKQFERYD